MKIIALFAFLVFTFVFIRRSQEKVDTPEFKKKYGAFLTNVETFKHPRATYYPVVFMFRRFVLAITVKCLKFNCVV